MNALINLALSTLKVSTSDRDAVAPGTHKVDATIRIRGTVKVGESFEQAVTASIPWQRIAVALFGVLARHIGRVAVNEALAAFANGETMESFEADSNALSSIFLGAMRETATKTVRGKVTTALKVEAIEAAPAAEEVSAVA